MENHSDAQPQGIRKIHYLITENDNRRAMNCSILFIAKEKKADW